MFAFLENLRKWRYYRVDTEEGACVIRAVAVTMLHLASRETPLRKQTVSNIIDLIGSWLRHGQLKDAESYLESLVEEGTFSDPERFMALMDEARPFPTDLKVILLSCALRAMCWSRLEEGLYPSHSPVLLEYVGTIAR